MYELPQHQHQMLTEHLRIVTSIGYKGHDNARWPKKAAECRPQPR